MLPTEIIELKVSPDDYKHIGQPPWNFQGIKKPDRMEGETGVYVSQESIGKFLTSLANYDVVSYNMSYNYTLQMSMDELRNTLHQRVMNKGIWLDGSLQFPDIFRIYDNTTEWFNGLSSVIIQVKGKKLDVEVNLEINKISLFDGVYTFAMDGPPVSEELHNLQLGELVPMTFYLRTKTN